MARQLQPNALLRDRTGANQVEYILILGVAALLSVAAFRYFGDSVEGTIAAQGANVDAINASTDLDSAQIARVGNDATGKDSSGRGDTKNGRSSGGNVTPADDFADTQAPVQEESSSMGTVILLGLAGLFALFLMMFLKRGDRSVA